MPQLQATITRINSSVQSPAKAMTFPVEDLFIRQNFDGGCILDYKGVLHYCDASVSATAGLDMLVATVRQINGSQQLTPFTAAFPAALVEMQTDTNVSGANAVILFRGNRYYVQETLATLLADANADTGSNAFTVDATPTAGSTNPAQSGGVYTGLAVKVDKAALPVSVKDYGAVGDGVTNDTTAIQNAITNNTAVYFPAGTYRIDTVTVPSNRRITGAGKGVSTLQYITAPTSAMLDCRGTSGAVKENIEITGLTFKNTTTHVRSGYAGIFIALDYTRRIQVHNCEFRDFNTQAIYLMMTDNNTTESQSAMIYNNLFHDGGAAAVGIYLDNQAEYVIVRGNSFHTLLCGVRLTNAANNQISGNTFLKCGGATLGSIDIAKTATNYGKTLIQGNTINHNLGWAIRIVSTQTLGQYGDNIQANEILITPTGYSAIILNGSYGTMVANNRIWTNATDAGIVLSDNGSAANYNMILNNMVLQAATAVSNTATGANNTVSGNVAGVSI